MAIRIDDDWHYEGNDASRERRVYRDALLMGRIRRWQVTSEDDELIRERFTAERWRDQTFIPIEGEQSDFDEALQRLVFYDAAN